MAVSNTVLIFDIGANVGKYTLVKSDIPNSKIIAIEAEPNIFNRLKTNTEHLNDVILLNCAISNSDKEFVDFYSCSIDVISTMNLDWLIDERSRFGDYNKNINKIKVRTRTIDSLIDEYGDPDLIKIDVEGNEHNVVTSLSRKTNGVVCFEWAAEWIEENILCVNHLINLGYSNFHVQMGDAYDYEPIEYEYDGEQLIEKFKTFVDKVDWGMIWTE